jgi:hypothetical protein
MKAGKSCSTRYMKARAAIRRAMFALAVPALTACAWATCPRAEAAPVVAAAITRHVVGPGSTAQWATHQLEANPSVIGLALSGTGASFIPPTGPTNKLYSPDCHALIDPGFSGKCVVAVAPTGTVAGVVEQEPAEQGKGRSAGAKQKSPDVQERDLVWRRQGQSWSLALVHVSQGTRLPSLVWADDVERDHDPKLIFVTPSVRSGFGTELDVVEATGEVVLYRFLGQGFANVAAAGGLVTYVPGWTEQHGPDNAYDQTLIGYSDGSWRVYSEQYVPVSAALRQHRGAFWDSQAMPAK